MDESVPESAFDPGRAQLEQAILQESNVADCRVLDHRAAGGAFSVAYLVVTGPFAPSHLNDRIRELLPDARTPDAYALVSALPRSKDGAIDDEALRSLPLVDEDAAAELEHRLSGESGVARAAVFVDEQPAVVRALHLGEVLKRSTGSVSSARTEASPAAGSKDGSQSPSAAPAAGPLDRPLAVSAGPKLTRKDDPTLVDVLERAADRFPDPRIVYLSSSGSTIEQSFSELLAHGRRIAAALQAAGFEPGQHVLFQLTEVEDIVPAFWGCLLGGFIPAMTAVPPGYSASTNDLERLVHVWELLESPILLTSERLAATMTPLFDRLSIPSERVRTLASLQDNEASYRSPARDPGDVVFLSLTSGSTGKPKAIMLSHRNILTRSEGTNRLCDHEESDRILNWLPFDHIGSISDWHLRCLDLGCRMVYCNKEYVLGEPLNWLRLMDRFRITHSWAPNFAYALVNDALESSDETWDLSSVKTLLTAGEAVSSNTVHEFLRRLASQGLAPTALRPAFGMAELGSGVTYYRPTPEAPVRIVSVHRAHLEGPLRYVNADDPDGIRFTSLGPVIPGASMRIVDDQNRPLPESTIGRLQIAGGPVFRGYYKNDEANAEVFVGDGWFNTGDRGFIKDGELYLTGRDKETLIINGANFYNGEIEGAVEEVAGVRVSFTAACAVRTSGRSEEQLALFFSPNVPSPAALPRLLRAVQNSVAKKTGVKPDFLIPVDPSVIPKTAIGKIQRKQLTRRFESGEFSELCQKADVLLENHNTVPDWFLAPSWRAHRVRHTRLVSSRRSCLLVVTPDSRPLAARLRAVLEREGASVDEAPLEAFEEAPGSYTHVFHLGEYGALDRTAPRDLSARAAERLHRLVRGAARLAKRAPPSDRTHATRLVVAASHSQATRASEALDPIRAATPALLKGFAQENPGVTCRHVDLPFASDADTLGALALALENESRDVEAADEVAYREGVRLVPSFARVKWPPPDEGPGLRPGASYVITGGLGGVGSELARYLLENYRARLLVTGRSDLARDKDKAATFAELERIGTVDYRVVEVDRPNALESAIGEWIGESGASLAGIFHLAGHYHEGPAIDETRASLSAIFGPKAEGAVNAHAAAARHPGAFVVCFSSLAGVFSGSGVSAYAAANRLLDALSHEDRRAGRRSYALDWSVWTGLGIGAQSAPPEILKARGYHAIAIDKGMNALAAALGRGAGQLLVGIHPTHPAIRRLIDEPAESIVQLRAAVTLREATDRNAFRPPPGRDRLGNAIPVDLWVLDAMPEAAEGGIDRRALLVELRGDAGREKIAPRTDLERQLAEIWQKVLGLDSVGVNESFFDVGGTSLLSVRLFAAIERRLGPSLPPATLFQASTIESLAALMGEPESETDDSIVALAVSEGAPNLFLVHDERGDATIYEELATHLSSDLSVYGLEPRRAKGFDCLETRIEDMAEHFVEKIRSIQPTGPYLIGGLGVGGILAYDVACRLQQRLEPVALVALIDAVASGRRPSRYPPTAAHAHETERPGGVGARLRKATRDIRASLRDGLKRRQKQGVDYARVLLLRYYTDRSAELPWFLQFIPTEAVLEVALSRYRPPRFEGRLTLYRASATGEDEYDIAARALCSDPSFGWEALASDGVEAIDVPGGHRSLLSADNAAAIASSLAARATELVGSSRRARAAE